MNYRPNRLAEEIKRVITDMLQTQLKDPRISSFTSITNVDVSKDLRYAKVYVSVLGDEDDQENLWMCGASKASMVTNGS